MIRKSTFVIVGIGSTVPGLVALAGSRWRMLARCALQCVCIGLLFSTLSIAKENPIKMKFEPLYSQWAKHCHSPRLKVVSDLRVFLDFPAYREILNLGRDVVPLIMEKYRTDDLPWGFALEELTHAGIMPKDGSYSSSEKVKWLHWWDVNKSTWVKQRAASRPLRHRRLKLRSSRAS